MKRILLAFLITAAASNSAFAHLDPAEHGSFAAGFSHPFFGLDHILAMVAVGLWAALLGGRAIWLVPTAFVGMMLAGFGVALGGTQLPFVEPIILTSVVAIGLFAGACFRASPVVGMAMVGFFAFFHGHAHGGELGTAGALTFSAGFALATALLHAAGLGLGLGVGRVAGGKKAGELVTRMAGGATVLAGLWLAVGA